MLAAVSVHPDTVLVPSSRRADHSMYNIPRTPSSFVKKAGTAGHAFHKADVGKGAGTQ